MKSKSEKFMSTASLWKVYFIMVLVIWAFGFTITSLMGLAFDNHTFLGDLMLSLFIALIISLVPMLMVSTMRQAERFYAVTKPLLERAEKCDTKDEWNALKSELLDFHQNHELGTFHNPYLNKITEILRVKKPYMK